MPNKYSSFANRILMAFACIHVPDFLVQSVARAEPALHGSVLALISGTPPLWSVVAANPAAYQAGIQLGMTKSQAEEFPGVEIRQRSEAQEKATHAALLDVAWSVSPRVEDTAPDTIVVDLDGLTSLFGADEKIAQELTLRASRIGVIPRVAVASNIEAAILAARGFLGITMIPAGEECEHLGGLPVPVLSTGTEVLETLQRWGVHTLRALAALPVLQLSERLGQEGVRVHKLAQGVFHRSLILALPNLHFEEEMELDDSVEELEPLSFLLGRLLDQLCARLEARALAVRVVHIQFDLEPSSENGARLRAGGFREKPAAKQYVKVLTLPVPMRDSKMLLKLLRLQLQADSPTAPIQKIILAADAAPPRVAQSGLFVPCAPDPEHLELTVARLAKLVGDSNVGAPELVDTHRSENFRVRKFSAWKERMPKAGKAVQKVNRQKSGASPGEGNRNGARRSQAGFRIIRPAVPAAIELREERPVRVCLRGMRGNVEVASGPWRSSGDWWQEDAWNQEEWDLTVDFGVSKEPRGQLVSSWPQYGVYRVYYDALRQSWFVRGFYD
jgi:protein ImuB